MMNDASFEPLRLLIASAHPIIQEGLCSVLASSSVPNLKILDIASSLPEAVRLVGEFQPHILLLDLYNLTPASLKTLALIHGEWPDLVIVGVGLQESAKLAEYMCAGVRACLPLQADAITIAQTLYAALRGETLLHSTVLQTLLHHSPTCSHSIPALSSGMRKDSTNLTRRELGVLQRVAQGERNKEIAVSLKISEPTVKTHLANIYFKLGVDSRASAVAVAMERGLFMSRQQTL